MSLLPPLVEEGQERPGASRGPLEAVLRAADHAEPATQQGGSSLGRD